MVCDGHCTEGRVTGTLQRPSPRILREFRMVPGDPPLVGEPRTERGCLVDLRPQHLGDAATRQELGDYPAALELFRRGQQADPGDPAFRNRAGTVLLELGRPAEAVPELEAALALRADPLYYYNLAQAHEALGDKAKAEQRYREGLKRCGSQPDLVGGLRRLLEAQGRTSELRGILLEAARGQQSPALYLEAAELALSEKDATAAEAAYKEALRLAPADPKVLAAFTSFLIRQRRGSQALELAKGAREALGAGGYLKLLSGMAETWVSRASYAEGIQLVAAFAVKDERAGQMLRVLQHFIPVAVAAGVFALGIHVSPHHLQRG